MPAKKKKTKSSKKNVLMPGKFFAAPVTIGRNCITVKLPKKVAEYFDLNKPEIFWSAIDGVIQLSGSQPHMVIPMMSVNTCKFIPQKTRVAHE
jgi:hypothetical protein